MRIQWIVLGLLTLCTAGALSAAPLDSPPAPLPAFLAAGPDSSAAVSPVVAALSGETTSFPATPAQTGCGPIRYFCQVCNPAATDQRLCSEKICGTFVILNCGDCSPRCILPPG